MGYYTTFGGSLNCRNKRLTNEDITKIKAWIFEWGGGEYSLSPYGDIIHDTSYNKEVVFDWISLSIRPYDTTIKGYDIEREFADVVHALHQLGYDFEGDIEASGEENDDFWKLSAKHGVVATHRGFLAYEKVGNVIEPTKNREEQK